MKATLAAGCLQVDAKPLRAALAPVPAAAAERMRACLLTLARALTRDALDDVAGRAAALAERPAGLEGYVAYLVRCEGGGARGGVVVRTFYDGPFPPCEPIRRFDTNRSPPPHHPTHQNKPTNNYQTQANHNRQVDERRHVAAAAAAADDAWGALAAHGDAKVATADAVKRDDLAEALAAFHSGLAEVRGSSCFVLLCCS